MEEVKKIKLKRPKLRNGENRVFRKGKLRKYNKGEFVDLLDSYNDKIIARTRIIDLKYKKYKNLENIDLINTCERSFNSQGSLIGELGLNSYEDYVTIIILLTNET